MEATVATNLLLALKHDIGPATPPFERGRRA
jgi:hypothetical protein